MRTINQWLIIGERRWARIIASELCAVLPTNETIKLLGNPKDNTLIDWRNASTYKNRIKIVEEIEPAHHLNIAVAIVANSAYLHRSSTEASLNAGYNVISEKPFTFSEVESNNLIALASKLNRKVISTNTYLFADYLRVFQKGWLANKNLSQLDIQWSDAAGESRYGQQKTYDSSIPIIYDVLPHIACLILATYGEVKLLDSTIKVLNGGSKVMIKVFCENINISISLERNATKRRRLMCFSSKEPDVTLDFTEEPGIVLSDEHAPAVSDLDWNTKHKPIEKMLICAKNYFENDFIDKRFHNSSELLCNKLIDSVADAYVEQQISFFKSTPLSESEDSHYTYAQKELRGLKIRVLQHLFKESPLKRFTVEI